MAYVDNAEKMESKDSFSEPDSLEVDECTEPESLEMDECTIELLLMVHVEKTPDEITWFLDSGCNNHMSGHKHFFSELDESFRKTVKLGDNSNIDVMGKGRIHLQVNNIPQVILEVFYIFYLKNNLLSIGQLQEKSLVGKKSGYYVSI